MRIIHYLSILLIIPYLLLNNLADCLNINNLIIKKNNKYNSFVILHSNLNPKITFVNNNVLQNKLIGVLNLVRYENIFPTIYLFLTGSFIVNPNINNLLLHKKKLLFSLIPTLCILMSNMIINDLFDIKLDKINNPSRPLITGNISIKEAIILLISLLSITQYFNIYFLNNKLQYIINLSLLYTVIYTPILKKIPLIKNLSCAFVVSSSIYLGALSTGIYKNINYLYQIMLLVFLGSLSNEILLDICDYDGDIKNKIYTLATLFGKNIALSISKIILNININSSILLMLLSAHPCYSFILLLLFIPILNDLDKVDNNYNIINVVNTAYRQLLYMLSLICLLSLK